MILDLFPTDTLAEPVVGQTLRPYQESAVAAVLREWETVQATLGIAATGCGKTSIFTEIIRRTGKRALILAHRAELVYQARERLAQFGIKADIEMADHRANLGHWGRAQAVVATPQTMFSGGENPRMTRFRAEDFQIVVADECHHFIAPAFLSILHYFRQHSGCKIFGCTATPDRADNEALSKVFQSVAFDYEILNAIDDGYLVPIRQQLVRVEGLDFSACRTTAGDLNGADLARVLEAEKAMQGIAAATCEIAKDKRTLIFTASVAQAEQLANILNRYLNGKADWIHGGTQKEIRADILKCFADGGTQALVNCAVLTEGYDNPAVECVVMARPTKSRCLYSQMIGRGTRTLPGVIDGLDTAAARQTAIAGSAKPFLTVLDFAGNSGRHKLVTTADILGGKISEEARALAKKRVEEKGDAADIREELEQAEIDILREIEEAKKRAAADKSHLTARAIFSATYVDPFADFLRRNDKWEGHVQTRISEWQRNTLIINGIDPSRLTVKEAVAMCFELKRATDKQRRLLYRYYPKPVVDKMLVWDASRTIDQLAKNGWKKI